MKYKISYYCNNINSCDYYNKQYVYDLHVIDGIIIDWYNSGILSIFNRLILAKIVLDNVSRISRFSKIEIIEDD